MKNRDCSSPLHTMKAGKCQPSNPFFLSLFMRDADDCDKSVCSHICILLYKNHTHCCVRSLYSVFHCALMAIIWVFSPLMLQWIHLSALITIMFVVTRTSSRRVEIGDSFCCIIFSRALSVCVFCERVHAEAHASTIWAQRFGERIILAGGLLVWFWLILMRRVN